MVQDLTERGLSVLEAAVGHGVTGIRRDSVVGAGWEMLFVAVDDHARITFTAMHPDEKKQARSSSFAMQRPTTPAWGSPCAAC